MEIAGYRQGIQRHGTGNGSAAHQLAGYQYDYRAPWHGLWPARCTVFGASHVDALEHVAVIDEETRDTFFTAGTNPLGKVLLLGWVPVRVIGVVSSSGATWQQGLLSGQQRYDPLDHHLDHANDDTAGGVESGIEIYYEI